MPFLENYFIIDQFGYVLLLLSMVVAVIAMIYGSNCILRGASNIARLFHISEFVIGITIVAISTSLPEFFVSADAAMQGMGVISLANVVGSNMFNITLIFMLLCFFSHKTFAITTQSVIVLNALNICMLGIALFVVSAIPRWVGGGFIVTLLLYFYWEFTHPSRILVPHAPPPVTQPVPVQQHALRLFIVSVLLLFLGILLLNVGSEYFLKFAKVLGVKLAISDKVVGILFIALGTSLPELAVTVSAVFQMITTKKNEETQSYIQDLASGNLIGSNIINILGVLGLSILIRPMDGIRDLQVDIVFMIVSCVVLILLLRKTLLLQRYIAVFQLIVLSTYIVYLLYLN